MTTLYAATSKPSPLVVYTYAGCDSCRRAVKWLRTHQIVFSEKPIRETPPSPAELRTMLALQEGQMRKLFNTSGQDYRAQKLGDKLATLSEVEAIGLLATNGNLVKRPFALGQGTAGAIGLVGFKADLWSAALA